MPTGNICFTCGRIAKETAPDRKAVTNRKWYASYKARLKAQRNTYLGD